MKVFFRYLKQVLPLLLLSVTCIAIESLADLMQPTLLANIVDIGVANHDLGYILKTAALMLGIVIFTAFAAAGRNIFSSKGSERAGFLMRRDMYRKIQTLSPDELDRFGPGTLMTRMTNDITQLQNLCHGMMRVFIKAPILCIGGIVMSFRLNPKLALIPTILVPVIFCLIFLNLKVGFPLYGKVQNALDRVNTVMREYLSGIRVVKAFNRFRYEVHRFSGPNEDLKRTSIVASRVMSIFNPAVTLIIYFGIVLIFWRGGIKVNDGEMQAGEIIAFFTYMTQILQSLNMFSMIFNRIVRAKASCARISEVLDSTDLQLDPENPEPLDYSEGITFDHVTFSYRGKKPALRDISFTCKVGEKVGVIGSTGSGKTSLISLILQFYQPTEGKITVFGADATKSDPRLVRDSLAVVPQRVMLFTGTILENLLWGKEDATREEVEAAAKAACAHDFIEGFREGYDTLIGHSGVNLSGGQRQRIAIARALIKKPKILILDDCLSAVDALTEASIRQSLAEEAQERGLLIVSQKISSIIDCDRIVVLDDGAAAGVGTHEELLSSCQVYRDIYLSQYGREALEEFTLRKEAAIHG
ncbi:MAG: ABC transporter ATP-binding protein [Ruminococcaceae bacterium]|nr:ABC transporter ATP-binding protein [Oscillospiraceae bacterium]